MLGDTASIAGALLDRLTHRVHSLEMNGESYRFKESVRRLAKNPARPKTPEPETITDDQQPLQEITE